MRNGTRLYFSGSVHCPAAKIVCSATTTDTKLLASSLQNNYSQLTPLTR
jgi:hypothetical protein